MNQKQWLASTDPQAMLDYLEEHTSDQKLRLFAVACCRRFWAHIAQDEASRQAVDVAERFADGAATVEECRRAASAIPSTWWTSGSDPVLRAVRETAGATVRRFAGAAATDACHKAFLLAGCVAGAEAEERGLSTAKTTAAERLAMTAERQRQVASIRCLFGNPFAPVAREANWLTSDVLALARGVSDEKAFARMPILADALQDAGCDNEDVLNHLRHGAEHVRGCWVLDLILGKL
jgi:hypothetical protein